MVNYLLDRGEKVDFKEVGQPKGEFADWIEPLTLALEQGAEGDGPDLRAAVGRA